MNKAYLLMISLLASASAQAEWTHFYETRLTNFYVDNASIQPVDGKLQVWILGNSKARKGSGEISFKSLQQFDCKEKMNRGIAYATFSEEMAAGDKLNETDVPSSWTLVLSGTAEQTLFKQLCP
ncbi:MAG: hypothetical protein LW714_10315 [Oxalobacteraceae bacterium]|jgi:hypothetical protein|nr:hypothetical protein [Oxalobacteraceae bacterium]